MAKNTIHIENLRIRFSGGPAGNVQEMANGIGREILKNLAGTAGQRQGAVKIDEVSAGKIRATGKSNMEIQRHAASKIVTEIRKKTE